MSFGRHYQNAYVTRDVAAAAARFRRLADVRTILEFETPVRVWTPQGEGTGIQKLAFVWIGDLNVELIEPREGAVLDIFRDALPEDDGLRFHHVCHRVDDWDDAVARIATQGFPVVLRGGTPDALQFCYVDTRPWLGHYTEYVWMEPDRWHQMGGRESPA